MPRIQLGKLNQAGALLTRPSDKGHALWVESLLTSLFVLLKW